jgi:hypothetical protein
MKKRRKAKYAKDREAAVNRITGWIGVLMKQPATKQVLRSLVHCESLLARYLA